MNKIIIIIIAISVIIINSVSAQNTKTEYKYLLLVNNQNTELIFDNLKNAEIVADEIIFGGKSTDKFAGMFFLELTESYFLTENYQKSLLSFFRAKYLFPSDTANDAYLKIAKESAMRCGLSSQIIEKIIETDNSEIINEKFDERILIMLKELINCNLSELYFEIYKYSEAYAILSSKKMPSWLQQWNFYVDIQIPNDKILQLINYSAENLNEAYKSCDENSQKIILIYSIKYYIENEHCKKALELTTEFGKFNLTDDEKKEVEKLIKKIKRCS